MFYKTDQYNDCADNFSKYLSSVDSFLTGNIIEGKWVILHLFMFLQSLFLVALRHENNFSIIKMKYSKTKNQIKYSFNYNLSIQELYNIDLENNIISLAPYFGTEESFETIFQSLKDKNVNITKKELKEAYKQMNKLLPISELFNKIKEIVTIDKKIEQSFSELIEKRDEFIHFSPKSWSIEIDFIKKIVRNCSELSVLLIKSNEIREYELDKNKMIKELNERLNGIGPVAPCV